MSDDTYFAALPEEEIGAELVRRHTQYYANTLFTNLAALQRRAWLYYYGYGAEGFHAAQVARGGQEGELALIRANLLRMYVSSVVSTVTAPKPIIRPMPESNTYEALTQAKNARRVIEHYQNNTELAAMRISAVESEVFLGEGFTLTLFDEAAGGVYAQGSRGEARTGNLRFVNPTPWDVIRDPMKRAWNLLDWVIVRTRSNRYIEIARYPDVPDDPIATEKNQKKRAALLNAPRLTGSEKYLWPGPAQQVNWSTDDVCIYRFYALASGLLPRGREVEYLEDGTVLKFDDLATCNRSDAGVFPLTRRAPTDLKDTPYGYTPLFEIVGLQELYDNLFSVIATNYSTYGTQYIAVQEGQDTSPIDIGGGVAILRYPEGGKEPKGVNLTAMPEGIGGFVASIERVMSSLMSVPPVSRGIAEGDRQSGSALALLQTQAVQQVGPLQAGDLKAMQEQATINLRLLRKYASRPIRIAAGDWRKSAFASGGAIKRDDLGDCDRVFMSVGNAASQTMEGRIATLQTFAQLKMPVSMPQAIEFLEQGRMEPITEASEEQEINIAHENEMIARGEKPTATVWDDHRLHMTQHGAPMSNPAARQKPEVIRAAREHADEHYRLCFGVPPEMPLMGPDGLPVLGPDGQPQMQRDPLFRDRFMWLTGAQAPPPGPETMAAVQGVGLGALPPPGKPALPPPAPAQRALPAPPGNPDAGKVAHLPEPPIVPTQGARWHAGMGMPQPKA